MNSSNDTTISTQTNQPHTATFQLVSTWSYDADSYQNPSSWVPLVNSVPSPIVLECLPSTHAQHQGPSRPLSYSEFVERTEHHWESLGNDVSSVPLKGWLRLAQSIRRDAKNFDEQGDFESAFVEYAKVATIVLKKIPSHPDYRVLLSTKHRHNMGLVSYFRPIAHVCGSVGRMHFPYESECIDDFIFRIHHDLH